MKGTQPWCSKVSAHSFGNCRPANDSSHVHASPSQIQCSSWLSDDVLSTQKLAGAIVQHNNFDSRSLLVACRPSPRH
ncbi:hypothetical protein EI94DRAFT_1747946 [Lactarius quietus]|nr:hypothetical protein EI94DRAFT_1747946 [Lactarius quietus]